MKVSIGCDHAGFPLKAAVIDYLAGRGIEVTDHGTNGPESVDYPDFVHPVATDVTSGKATFGIVMCGSGNGVNMTVNKHAGIRSALCWKAEIALMARQHNNANIIALPVRYISEAEGIEMIRIFLDTPFEGGRHENRVRKIDC